jgi:Domain of Unknown Function (DUF1080)
MLTRRSRNTLTVLFLTSILCVGVNAWSAPYDGNAAFDAASARKFLGRWDITVKTPNREYPSWLELRIENGQLVSRMVGQWAHAQPLVKVEVHGDTLSFVSPQGEWDRKDDMPFEGSLVGGSLKGTTKGADGTPWTWTGQRAPDLKRKGEAKWGNPVELFNGKDLTGWHQSGGIPGKTWTVVDGALTSPEKGPEIINDLKFKDFKLHVEFNCGAKSNSGVYLRGRYEVQVEDNSIQDPPSQRMGGIYGFIAADPAQPRTPDVWQTYDITLIGRTITVVQNGHIIVDHQEIPGITGGALDSHEGEPGPIYLQGSEDGHVAYRKVVITPAVD